MFRKLIAGMLPSSVKPLLRKWRRRLTRQPDLKGYPESVRIRTPIVDGLPDQALISLNQMLDWNSFTVDSRGRRFGGIAYAGKRSEPQAIPDPRIEKMHDIFQLGDKHVLEIGCFEGIHTVGLAGLARTVTAVDSRIENIVKTAVRCAMFDVQAHLSVCNVESSDDWQRLPAVDIVHHVGVLYHLHDPVRHLLNLGKLVRVGLMIDTHYANEHELTGEYLVNGTRHRYRRYGEGGYGDAFSGMYDHAKWLLLDDILQLLGGSGFGKVVLCEKREERNGSRALIIVRR